MCDSRWLAAAETGATGLRAGTQIAQARYEQAAAKINEGQARRQERLIREAGGAQAASILMDGRRLAARQRAAFGSAGVDTSTGSALDVLTDTGYMAALDAQTALDNANQRADVAGTEANAQKEARRFSRLSAPAAVGGTLLTGGSRAYGIYKGLSDYDLLRPLRRE